MKQLTLKGLIIFSVLSLACTTKVSEWVLLNSLPDKYILVYFHKNKLTESEKKKNAELENRFNSANILLKTIQIDKVDKPYYALYFNNRLITEYENDQEMLSIASSPMRERVASELMAGKLCVMLYLTCGNEEKDRDGIQIIKNSVATSPFAEVITILEVERQSKVEKQFVSMLLNVESDLNEIQEPMLFGVFGRFRALEPLLAKGISEENINLMIDFFTADCSCLIKDDLPGTSILYNGKWDNPQTALVNKIMDENPHLEH
jgi:hypothetical protein